MLDRFLNVVNTIDLRKQNIFQAKAIGQSYDNKIWVYDEMENKLKKIDEDGKLLQETPDFRLIFNQSPSLQKYLMKINMSTSMIQRKGSMCLIITGP